MPGDRAARRRGLMGRRARGLWVLCCLTPFGLGSWAGFAYAARRAGFPRWYVWAAVYAVLSVAGFALAVVAEDDSGLSTFAGFLLLVPWAFSLGHALAVRSSYVQRVEGSDRFAIRVEAARDRVQDRENARRLAREQPGVAVELGVGRPDRQGAEHAGLVDVNNAPVKVLDTLPGVDGRLARRIVKVREEVGGFASVEEMGMTLDLAGDLVERLRDDVVFLPR